MHDFIQLKTIQSLGCWSRDWDKSPKPQRAGDWPCSHWGAFLCPENLCPSAILWLSCKETEQISEMFMNCFSFFFFFSARFYNIVSLALWLEGFSLAGSDPASPSGVWILLNLGGFSDGGAAENSPRFIPVQVSQWNSVRRNATGTSQDKLVVERKKKKIRSSFFLLCRQLDPLDQGGLLVLLGPN